MPVIRPGWFQQRRCQVVTQLSVEVPAVFVPSQWRHSSQLPKVGNEITPHRRPTDRATVQSRPRFPLQHAGTACFQPLLATLVLVSEQGVAERAWLDNACCELCREPSQLAAGWTEPEGVVGSRGSLVVALVVIGLQSPHGFCSRVESSRMASSAPTPSPQMLKTGDVGHLYAVDSPNHHTTHTRPHSASGRRVKESTRFLPGQARLR